MGRGITGRILGMLCKEKSGAERETVESIGYGMGWDLPFSDLVAKYIEMKLDEGKKMMDRYPLTWLTD